MTMPPPVAVAVALIHGENGTLLLCQRAPGKRYALQWEFAGGKVEPGESPEEALRRELREELGIEAEVGSLYHEQIALYPDDQTFAVRYYNVERWTGDLVNNVFADLRWVKPEELLDFDILTGNREICERLAYEPRPERH